MPSGKSETSLFTASSLCCCAALSTTLLSESSLSSYRQKISACPHSSTTTFRRGIVYTNSKFKVVYSYEAQKGAVPGNCQKAQNQPNLSPSPKSTQTCHSISCSWGDQSNQAENREMLRLLSWSSEVYPRLARLKPLHIKNITRQTGVQPEPLNQEIFLIRPNSLIPCSLW